MSSSTVAAASCEESTHAGFAETGGQQVSQSERVHAITHEFFGPPGGLVADSGRRLQRVRETTRDAAAGESTTSPAGIADFSALYPQTVVVAREARATFSALQEWEGCVLQVNPGSFTASLVDLTAGATREEEEADFPLDDLLDSDRAAIRPGAVFRWAIGYRRAPGGSKERVSRIVFRRLPAWTERELVRNRQDAAEWARSLAGE